MKQTPVALLLVGLFVCGCANSDPADRAASDLLGPGAVHVLSFPTKVEGWDFQRSDGSIVTEPAIRPLDLAIAKDLGAILLSEDAYRQPARGGGFARGVGYRVWRGEQSVDVLLSFANDQMMIKSMSYSGQPTSSVAGVTASRDALLRVTQKAFPEYKAPAK